MFLRRTVSTSNKIGPVIFAHACADDGLSTVSKTWLADFLARSTRMEYDKYEVPN